MISRRRVSRTRSYSTRFRISEVSRSLTGSLLDAVRRGEDPDRVLRLSAGPLLDLERRERAVGRGHGRIGGRDRVEQRLCELQRKRSEEHTSELQSPCNIVCRLLL